MDESGFSDASPARTLGLATHGRVLASAAMLGGMVVLVKLAAFGKDWLVARRFGASDDLDAFLVALVIPSYAVVVLAQSFGMAFMPTYIRVGSSRGSIRGKASGHQRARLGHGGLDRHHADLGRRVAVPDALDRHQLRCLEAGTGGIAVLCPRGRARRQRRLDDFGRGAQRRRTLRGGFLGAVGRAAGDGRGVLVRSGPLRHLRVGDWNLVRVYRRNADSDHRDVAPRIAGVARYERSRCQSAIRRPAIRARGHRIALDEQLAGDRSGHGGQSGQRQRLGIELREQNRGTGAGHGRCQSEHGAVSAIFETDRRGAACPTCAHDPRCSAR